MLICSTLNFFLAWTAQDRTVDHGGETAEQEMKSLGEGNKLFSDSFKSVDVSDDDDIPLPANASCKLSVGCRQVATYKNSIGIACAQHATSDMKPFNPANKKRKHINNSDHGS